MKYGLFFFLPGDTHYRMAEFDTDFVPPAYQVGDLIDARDWDPVDRGDHGIYFRIRSIVHKVIPEPQDKNNPRPHQVASYLMGIHLDEITEDEFNQTCVGRKREKAKK